MDLVLVSAPDIVDNLTVGEPFSDHNAITFSIPCWPYERRQTNKVTYSYSKADWAYLRELLHYIPWHCAFLDDDINIFWSAWSDLLFAAIDECIPKRQIKTRKNAPWITSELIKLCKKKKKLYKKAKRSGLQNDWNAYRIMNNFLKKACNSARREHINKISEDLKSSGNPKPFWSFVSSVRKGSNELTALKVDDVTLTDDLEIAESMNSYFLSVFTSEDYVNFPVYSDVVDSKLSTIFCNTNEVSRLLRNLNPHKSPGPDHLPPRVLKECAIEIAPTFCSLLNRSFFAGAVPHAWKLANIVPVHKKGRKDCRDNYRQISLTSIACKVSEKIVKNRVVNFWQALNVFNPSQFGFLEGKSTLTQLLCCFDDWASSRNKSKPTDVIFLDFSKAFDSVPHERLLLKLKGHGIDGSLLRWFRSFLTDRKQRVVVRGTYSSWSRVTSGVPQGTILGPILFLIYVNDMSSNISSTLRMFADDTKVYRELSNIARDSEALQFDVDQLASWASKWQLRFNSDKCEVLRITHKRDSSLPSYSLDTSLKTVKCVKDLGIMVSSDLSWSEHVNVTINKANKLLGLVQRTVGSSNPSAFSTLYKSLVRPILEYAVPVWNPYLSKDVLALEKVQRRASRLALGQKRGEMEYEDRLRKLKWPTLETRRLFLSLVECYKIVFGINKLNFDDLFEFTKCNSTRANHPYKLYLKPAKCNPYKYSFPIRIVRDWNSLPRSIVEAGSLDRFKSALKRFLF